MFLTWIRHLLLLILRFCVISCLIFFECWNSCAKRIAMHRMHGISISKHTLMLLLIRALLLTTVRFSLVWFGLAWFCFCCDNIMQVIYMKLSICGCALFYWVWKFPQWKWLNVSGGQTVSTIRITCNSAIEFRWLLNNGSDCNVMLMNRWH